MSQIFKPIASTPPPPGFVEFLAGNDTVKVGPDGSDNINIVGDGTTVTVSGNPGTNTLTISLVGGLTAIETIQGDTGSITGNTVTIFANNTANNSGASVKFVNSGTVSTLNLTDSNNNTFIGKNSGNTTLSGVQNNTLGSLSGASLTSGSGNNFFGFQAGKNSLSGVGNVGIGNNSLFSLTTGSQNCGVGNNTLLSLTAGGSNLAFGVQSLSSLVSGINNTCFGTQSGISYTSNESNNICINNPGVIGDSRVIRLGQLTAQTTCFIQGISGVTVSNQNFVTINSSTGQLGVTTFAPVYAYTATAVSYQVLITDKIIGVTSNAAARTITMPNSGMVAGQSWTIKDEAGTAASANNITISGNGANIDGSATAIINKNYGSYNVYWNGSNFFIF